jgi:penicillin amidase
MSEFVRKDPRLLACRDPSWAGSLFLMLYRHAVAGGLLLALGAALYFGNIWVGMHAAAQVRGAIDGLGVRDAVTIARDGRGIPHIRARNLHDLFFAEGFVQAEDRLFEMDLARRYAYGTLAEVFGEKALGIDERMRGASIRSIAARQWRDADARTRAAQQAFSDGINAAETREPLPVEFRMLLYRPQRWSPRDSIAVSLVAALELGDSWYDVVSRDERLHTLGLACYNAAFPISDSRYDVTVDGRFVPSAAPAASCDARSIALMSLSVPQGDVVRQDHHDLGSNAWAAGAARTRDRHALIANDPHVDLTIPGIWYAVDMRAPGFHAAGAVIPGLPGVVLGHNERIAWAVTNAEVATASVYRMPHVALRSPTVERFGVRFGGSVLKTYYRTQDAFSIAAGEDEALYLVRWPQYVERRSEIATLLALDRASDSRSALHVLAGYRGAPQNFIVADTRGRVAYHLAGALYDDPAWGRYVHPARDLSKQLKLIAYSDLPQRAPSRTALLLTANNRVYGPGYGLRLSAQFEPPYRAYRIARLLHARAAYDAFYFERMQLDACSPVDAEISRELGLPRWNGCFVPQSTTATMEHDERNELAAESASLALALAKLRTHAAIPPYFFGDPKPWAQSGRVEVPHPLSPYWYGLLQGRALRGDGDEYSIHLQEPGFAQGFRAVWDAGSWDEGGLVLPSGESGEPGSGHYDDLARTWINGKMIPLPFSQRAVDRSTVDTLVLR